ETIYIGWKRPQEGWIKFNNDMGACKDRGEIAGCGGLIRDSIGRWIKGYTRNLRLELVMPYMLKCGVYT
ncbi:ribonuclease H, partial [Trifolium medium]|nr:ribonuclease H [Trifolium medium]